MSDKVPRKEKFKPKVLDEEQVRSTLSIHLLIYRLKWQKR